jgi:hypothetical protein
VNKNGRAVDFHASCLLQRVNENITGAGAIGAISSERNLIPLHKTEKISSEKPCRFSMTNTESNERAYFCRPSHLTNSALLPIF